VRPDEIPESWLSYGVVLALVTPGHRAAVEAEARARGFASFPAVVDPTALVPTDVGKGRR
jgi:hypothetical protein